ncbi:ABC transporter ATP-binding protein [Solitalea lacus]|uniref:ABC transporter ATP-binding protein n=1 Tax=Solitalea lacus TaxID=2911172 RepID=UPI001EDA3689|nr:ATP-binding cassette domain-containing protein [Solitalea lacus]UKJ06698.1 ATP-binding cassette domain-containing protein [Solitalea lacus]
MPEEKPVTELKTKVSEATPVIMISHLKKSFGNNMVLNDFNLILHKGENVAVLGKSGSGKSVLIKCIIGLLDPDEGTINVLGKNIPDLSREELDRIRVKVGFLFQSNALYDSMTVRENLEFPLRRHGFQLAHQEVDEMVKEALTNVGLAHTIDMMPAELSGGMRKRIALARTLILKPEIILYDEPTTGLDPITGKEISNLMVEIQNKYNTASLVISHDMKLIHDTAERIVMLIDGKCYADGTYKELQQIKDNKVRQFFE